MVEARGGDQLGQRLDGGALEIEHALALVGDNKRALVVPDKAERVFNFQRATVEALAELVAAAGLDHPTQFSPAHFSRRVSPNEVKSFSELYPTLSPGELIAGTSDKRFEAAWAMASAHEFRAMPRAA